MSHAMRRAAAQQALGVWTPLTPGNLRGWWDASDAATVHATGGAVDTWDDKSGGGYNLTAAGTARATTGTRTINSLNALDFDGANNKYAAQTFSLATATWSLYAVTLVDDTTGTKALTTVNQDALADWSGTLGAMMWINDGQAYFNNGYATALGTMSTVTAAQTTRIRNGATWTCRLDAVDKTGATTSATAHTANKINVGCDYLGNSYYNGAIGEILIYAAAHGTTDRNNAEAYLKAKWGTP